MDDVPEIQLTRGPHGAPSNPHVVTSAVDLRCAGCGAELGRVLTERMVAARAAKEVDRG